VPGEVIIPEEVYAAADEGHEPERVPCDLASQLVPHLAGRGLKLRSGRIVCVSRIAVGERRTQLHAGGAIGVDMESVWLAAGARGRPFGVVRVVLDSPSHELLRVQAIGGALRAARALRRVAGALHDWAPAG
jgi:4-hydroxy-3-methylbut-2-enyl diphosphate reductase